MTAAPSLARRPTPDTATAPSSILLKVTMAASGVVLFGFVFVHMVGNLKVYLGASSLDEYAAWLLDLFHPLFPEEFLVWTLRAALLVAVVVHMVTAAVLARRNQAAVGHTRDHTTMAPRHSWTARTMPVTGIAVALFVVFHVLDLTIGTANPDFVRGDVYANLVASLQRPVVALVYLASMLLLGGHLLHGLWSAFTSLGVTGSRLRATARQIVVVLAGVVVVGNASIPIAVQVGLVQ